MTVSYDCRRLLQYAVRAEADISSVSSSIDDSNPPQLFGYTIRAHQRPFLLLLAYTKHAMAAQLYGMESEEPWMESNPEERMGASRVCDDPVEIVLLRSDDDSEDETITCVAVVEPSGRSISLKPTRSITSTSSLIKGVMSLEEDTPAPDTIMFSSSNEPTPTLAIVFGTTMGNLYTVPLEITNHRSSAHDYSLQRVSSSPNKGGTSLSLVMSHPSLREVEFTSRDVLSVSTTTPHSEALTETLLTIVYQNATFIRLPTSACFPPVDPSPGDSIRHRARLRLPPAARVLPLPPVRATRSPLQDVWSLSANHPRVAAVSNEALVYYPEGGGGGGRTISSELVPTWAIYAASMETDLHASALSPSPLTDPSPPGEPDEDDDDEDDDGILFVSVTKALVGSAVGAWRWSVRHKPPPEKQSSSIALEPAWVDYTVSSMWHDAPRAIDHATVDPVHGNLIATTDSLGRIVLMERSTRQIIRMWKGFRDASCYWIQQQSSVCCRDLHLVIHSRQRRRIEVWQVRHGGRVLSLAVGRGAQVVPLCSLSGAPQCLWTVTPHRLEWMQIPPPEEAPFEAPTRPVRALSKAASNSKQQSGALRLKHLQQLLSASSHLRLQDVRAALYEIQSLADLATALDLCATGSVLDNTLGVQGSSFHREVIAHCRSVLATALRGDGHSPDRTLPSRTNPMVVGLTQKLECHEKLVKAYDILYKFEGAVSDSTYPPVQSPSHWAAEAMAWASTYEQVTGLRFDKETARSMERMRFSDFAASCRPGTEGQKTVTIYFSESSRTRRCILEHVFRPLLGDVFSINIAYSIFDALGTRSDLKYLQQCFGEWFMTLSVREACKKGLYSDSPPMMRFLLDLVVRQLSSDTMTEENVALEEIYKFCTESTDLVRAFMLGALCLEAVSTAVSQKEKWNHIKALNSKHVNDWKSILRKLRICLLVSLRLHGKKLAAPISIDNVNQPDIFSVYEWLARDELSMSHNHEEIVSLEKACSISSYSFDPSSPEGDGPSRFKMLQNSCLAAAISEEERAEYLVDFHDEDRFGALLLFMSSHNAPKVLAAHRSLLLAFEWGSHPEQMDCLNDALVSLTTLSKTPGFKSLASGVCLEIWQSQLCPVYRAVLFGFADVQELSEDVVAPLLQNRSWLTSVGRTGLQLLAILQDCKVEGKNDFVFEPAESSSSWPPTRPDFVLQKLVDKMPKPIEESALNIHSVVLCAFLISSDMEALVKCVPSVYELFVPLSLFKPMSHLSNVPDLQQSYLNNAIIMFAKQFTGPPLEGFDLGEIVTLAKVWNFDLQVIRTLFLLAMYELGKDSFVDELVTKSSFQIDGKQFVEEGVVIVCSRLNMFLSGNRMRTPSLRNIVGILDAELCEWMKQVASNKTSLLENPVFDVAIETTHLFVMRLLSLSASFNVDKALRVRIHSLLVLSGILVKAISSN